MLSLVIPIYKNEANIPALLSAVADIAAKTSGDGFEAVFVVDGSPDHSYAVLKKSLPAAGFASQLIVLSRNFGAFAAIKAGLEHAKGDTMAVMAADLQEPPELVVEMHQALLNDECDVAIGERAGRDDPLATKAASGAFWWLYRKLIAPEIPPGGVDIFACKRIVRDQLVALKEQNSSLVGLLFWVGFRRKLFPYQRRKREIGASAWSFAKKWKYMQDSIFSFTDLPIILLIQIGLFGIVVTTLLGFIVLASALVGAIDVPGYAATMLVMLFLGTLQLFFLGVLGVYIWRVFENTKGRPGHIAMSVERFSPPCSP